MSWTEDRVTTLTKLWLDGASASECAKRLGGVSRNAVIGKVTRLGLAGRAPASAPTGAPKPAQKAKPAGVDNRSVRNRHLNAQLRVVAPPTAPPAPVVVAPTPAPVLVPLKPTASLQQLGRHACRWPIGDPSSDGFGFCGRSTDRTYCDEHARVAFKPPPPRDKTAKPNGKLPLWATR